MRNALKSLFIAVSCLIASTTISAETLYIVSGKCNVPLKAGMNSAKYQIFTWDGSNAAVTTDITCDVTGTGSSYYNTSSLSLSDIKTLSNYSTGSSSARTMQAIKLTAGATMTISLGSKTFSKAVIVGRANSGDKLSIDILGETISTNDKNTFFVVEKEQTFSGNVKIANTTGKEYNFFVYLVEGQGGPTPDPGKVTGITVSPTTMNFVLGDAPKGIGTTITPSTATNKNVTWESDKTTVATVSNGLVTAVGIGTAHITATTVDGGFTATCTVNVTDGSTPPPTYSDDATLKSLTYGGTSVPNFSPTTYDYTIELTAGIKTPPTIDAETNHPKATKVITQASSVPGSGNVVVTAEDGTTKLTYTVNYTTKADVPSTTLTTHVPEVYEAKGSAGGYDGTLTIVGGREYEVYYAGKDPDSKMTVDVKPNQKQTGITVSNTETSCKAPDGWFEAATTSISNYTNPDIDEFIAGNGSVHKMQGTSYKMHIKGFDQFSIYAADKNTELKDGAFKKEQRFQIFIDGNMQPETQCSTSATIRRYNISTGEHVIEVKALSGGASLFYGFSLRVAQEPRTKYLKGNDSTQVIMQTTAIRPITYVTKYNNIAGAETKLEWTGNKATGIELKKTTGTLSDTLRVSGVANCAVGEYHYAVVAYLNGSETSRAIGKFKVASDIQATSDVEVEVYQNEDMDKITFNYFALSAEDVKLTWPSNKPNGISGSGNNGRYTIGGTPTTIGTFPYEITVTGADTIIKGKITVNPLSYGENAVLYLYKNNLAYDKDAVYSYIQGTNKWNLVARKAKEDGLRPAAQYKNYKWVLISEDADANNAEVLAVVRGGSNLPVLNMKGFSYASDRLNWGEPDNGAIDSTTTKVKGTYLHILHANHPIYTAKMNYLKTGDSIQILSNYESKGIMPINVNVQGSLCLGTAYTRDIENYFGAGELQTALHEVPAELNGGHKYICLPIARQVTLSNQGKNLIDGIIAYLTSPNAAGVEAPDLQINRFSVAGFDAKINQNENSILLSIPAEEYDNLETAHPTIELADPNTHVIPSVEPDIDLRYALYIPRTLVVTDYINRRAYDLSIEVYDPQGIEEVYEIGMWVNVYDIYGHKITTTNENIYNMELPRGVYVVVTESGNTIKILK